MFSLFSPISFVLIFSCSFTFLDKFFRQGRHAPQVWDICLLPEFEHQDLHFSSQFVIINLTWHTSVEFWPCLHFCSSVTLFTIVDASVDVYRASALCSSLLDLTHAPLLVSMNMCSFSTFSRFLIPSVSAHVQYFRETPVHTGPSRLEFPQPLFAIDLYLLTSLNCWWQTASRFSMALNWRSTPRWSALSRRCSKKAVCWRGEANQRTPVPRALWRPGSGPSGGARLRDRREVVWGSPWLPEAAGDFEGAMGAPRNSSGCPSSMVPQVVNCAFLLRCSGVCVVVAGAPWRSTAKCPRLLTSSGRTVARAKALAFWWPGTLLSTAGAQYVFHFCCQSWGALCRCCATCWKTVASLQQLPLCCPLRLLRFWLLVPDCLRQLLLLHGRGCRCRCLVVQVILHLNICAVALASYVCQNSVLTYCVKRSFSWIPIAGGEHHKITVRRKRSNRDVDNIGVWRGAGGLCHQTLLHARKSHSASLCITANAANRPPSCSCVDKSTHSINSCDDTTASALPRVAATAVSLPPPRALAPDAAVTVLPLSHSAALFLLTHLLPRALRGLCCICCPTFSFVTAPPVMLWRHHAGPSATLTRPASYKVHAATAPLLFPSSISWLFFFTFTGARTTHVNLSISHNVLPFVRWAARFHSQGTRCLNTLPDFANRNHRYYSSICRSSRSRSLMRLLS